MKKEVYVVEFSDEESRKYNDVPYNQTVIASSREEAKRKVTIQAKRINPKAKIKIEGVYSP